jgi:DNA replication protein DnaC
VLGTAESGISAGCGRWGEVFGDDTVAAMIDNLVHHAEVIALKGDSYRLKDRDLGRVPAATTDS